MGIVMNVIGVFTILIIISAIYIEYRTAGYANENIILGATVPYGETESEEIKKLVKEFKKENKKYTLLSFVLVIPIFFIKSIAVWTMYIVIIPFILMILQEGVLYKYFNKVQRVKKDNGWLVGRKHSVKIDTELTKIKNKMPISRLYFVPVIIINIIFIIIFEIKIIPITSLISVLAILGLNYNFTNLRSKVYSDNSQINIACNYFYKRIWSIVTTILAYIIILPNLGFFININLGLIFLLGTSPVILMIIFWSNNKIISMKSKVLKSNEDLFYYDEDEYWKFGFYNNPNDNKVFVEKRVGIGTTLNMANKKAKWFYIGIIIFTLSILMIVFSGVSKFENCNINMMISESAVKIDVPEYETEFSKDDIEEVNKINELLDAVRTNGYSDDKKLLGYCNVEGYGRSLVYINKDQEEIISIKLKDKYIFITGNSKEETDTYYNELINLKQGED